MLTERENYLMMLRGEHPEWVPVGRFFKNAEGAPPPTQGVLHSLLMGYNSHPEVDRDVWGVRYVGNPEAAGGKMPAPNEVLLTDIRKWHDVIKAPDISGIDFEQMAKKDLEYHKINREESAVTLHTFVGPFQQLVSFMGFTELFMAMVEEPEEVRALADYVTDFYIDVVERSIDFYKPDIFGMCQDNAAWANPFFSLEAYRELFKPAEMRLADVARKRGIFIDMHNCGHCEIFVDDWQDLGVVSWNPAQTCNDIAAIKAKYKEKLVIVGAWDGRGELASPDATEEAVKQSVIETIDRSAPGGAYMFSGAFLGSRTDERIAQKNKWVMEAAEAYCKDFYKTHK